MVYLKSRKRIGRAGLAAAAMAGAACSAWAGASIDFTRDIRPIFSEACFACHGPDEAERKAGLRLDTFEGATGDLGGYAAVVPGHPSKSELLQRVTASDPDDRMPPADSGKGRLTEIQVAKLRQWIEEGASWGEHWAFVPPTRPELPAVKQEDWVRNPVDRFTLARIEAAGLRPSQPADRVTLIRRLSLDLTGLPPSIGEVDAFVVDSRPNAPELLAERLLKSPHYGEKWGRWWLDAARYADSNGFEKDKPRAVWLYRDWVVNALNQDLPYDEFVIRQLAGDLLPDAAQDQLVATGFLRNSMTNEEGGVHPEQFRMEAMFDRMDAIGKGILGLTIQCAQCHAHKYDPLTQEDYYRMFAFINDSHEGSIAAWPPLDRERRQSILREIRGVKSEMKRALPDWKKRLAEWEKQARGGQPEWTVFEIGNSGNNAQRYYHLKDGSRLAQGYAPTRFTATFTNTVHMPDIRAFRLEVFRDPNLPAQGPGRSVDGLFALTEFKVQVEDAANPKNKQWVKFGQATADFSNERTQLGDPYADKQGKRRFTGPVDYAIDGDQETAWGIDAGPGRRNQDRKAVFLAETNVAFPKGTKLLFHLDQKHGGWNSDDNQNMNLGRFRISASAATEARADPLPRRVREILKAPASERSPGQMAAVFDYWRTTVPEWKEANARIEALWQQHPESTTQLVLARREDLRETHFLNRGDMTQPGKVVAPGVPGFLHSLDAQNENPNRLDFARWMVSRDSPTAARAIVNRVWQEYFGIGIVETAEDLGSQASAPSHPKLLDWLAVEFMENGWSLKWLHRTIVHSATYRQTSEVTPHLQQRDPYNRLLARGARFRVNAESVRDIALAVSGLLNPELGGPPVHPPAPGFLFEPPASYGPKTWNVDQGGDRYRRALYTFRFRSVPYPVLQAFDAPNGDASCVRRSRSNTPLQALAALNEPLFLECARALGERAIGEGGATDRERIVFAFRCCVGRAPKAAELTELEAFLDRQQKRFGNEPEAARKLLGTGGDAPGENPVQRAAYAALARVLLNLDETITKE